MSASFGWPASPRKPANQGALDVPGTFQRRMATPVGCTRASIRTGVAIVAMWGVLGSF